MLSATGTGGNNGDTHGFGKSQTHVLQYWKSGGKENMHHF